MLNSVAPVSKVCGGHGTVEWEDFPITVLAALGGNALQHPEHLEFGAITVITRTRGAVELYASTTGDEVLTALISSA